MNRLVTPRQTEVILAELCDAIEQAYLGNDFPEDQIHAISIAAAKAARELRAASELRL